MVVVVHSTAVALVGAVDLIGHPARTVHVLTIFAGPFTFAVMTAPYWRRRPASR